MIKKLAQSIREYKLFTILTPILMIGEVSCECVIPMITAKLINAIEAGTGMQEITKYGLILVLMALISLAFGALAGITCATASSGFAKNLRKDLFYRVQGFSFSNIDRFSTSSRGTRMTTDLTHVQMAFMMIIRIAVRAPLMLIFATVMGAVVGKKLALIFCCIIPLLGLGLGFVIYNAMPLF
ncbi:MAG: ABC transporter ATP-binding protein, partial [Clostridia bacterium]|nr:ABC transporter ATP-binding protein [Clostridia bacterium]